MTTALFRGAGRLVRIPQAQTWRPWSPPELSKALAELVGERAGDQPDRAAYLANDARLSFHEFAVAAGELNQSDVFMSVVPTPFGFGIWSSHFTPTILGVPTVLMPRGSGGKVAKTRLREDIARRVAAERLAPAEHDAVDTADSNSIERRH